MLQTLVDNVIAHTKNTTDASAFVTAMCSTTGGILQKTADFSGLLGALKESGKTCFDLPSELLQIDDNAKIMEKAIKYLCADSGIKTKTLFGGKDCFIKNMDKDINWKSVFYYSHTKKQPSCSDQVNITKMIDSAMTQNCKPQSAQVSEFLKILLENSPTCGGSGLVVSSVILFASLFLNLKLLF